MNFYRAKINRQKLNKTFWWIIAHSEIDKAEAYRMVENVTGKQHLHELSNYEFKRVVDELIRITGVEVRKPLPKRRSAQEHNIVRKGNDFIELVTREQLAIIELHADKLKMSQAMLQGMVRKVTGGNKVMSVLQARTLIEILKSMLARGWKEKYHIEDAAGETGQGDGKRVWN